MLLCPADPTTLTAMSYNMYAWNALQQNPWKAENMFRAIRQVNI